MRKLENFELNRKSIDQYKRVEKIPLIIILDNVRNSIRNNLNFFLNMNKEQILLHRKNKFLSIGRGRGLSSGTTSSDNLSMKTNVLNKFLNKFLNNKNYFIISIFVTILILLYLFLL